MKMKHLNLVFALCLLPTPAVGRHFQFQLSGFECFYEDIVENTECTLEYAPISGAEPRIDAYIEDPNGNHIYNGEMKDYDLHKFTAAQNGTYTICFSNVFQFSIGQHLVYFDFNKGEDAMGFETVDGSPTQLTQMEKSCLTLHENFNLVERYQNYYRLREANGQMAAEYLSQRVQWWSLGQSAIVVSVGVIQVYLLRRFFTVSREEI